MPGKLYFVTGIAGTGIAAASEGATGTEKALDKFGGWRSRLGVGAPVKVIKLEDEIARVAKPYLEALEPGRRPRWFRLLELPRPTQVRIWQESFTNVVPKISEHRDEGKDVFFTFHACWYHLLTRQFTSIIDLRMISQLRPDIVFTLVDDIYDVCARLSVEGGIFPSPIRRDPAEDRIFKLLTILDWRAFEETLAERIAALCGDVPHVVFAVKHPLATFSSLLDGKCPTVYLAHPIGYVRDLWREGGSDKHDTANAFVREVEELTSSLRQDFTVLEPTAIDELCFAENEFGPRWPQPGRDEDLLWRPPLEDFWNVPEGQEEVRNALTGYLEDKIKKHINARDHKLVEQSAGVVAYRPCAPGYEAKGVKEELQHWGRLHTLGERTAVAYVLHPPQDELARRHWELGNVCTEWWQSERLRGDESEYNSFVKEGVQEVSVEDIEELDGFAISSRIRTVLDKYHLDLYDTRLALGPLEREPAAQREESQEQLGQEFLSRAKDCYLWALQDQGAAVIVSDDCTASVFASDVARQWSSTSD